MKFTGNPIIRDKYTADPTVLVHHDTLYLYTGHDEPPAGEDTYVMKDWLLFSTDNMLDWKEYPSPLKATDFRWAKGDAYASKVIEHKGKFYWFVSVSHAGQKGKAIGIAVASLPTGPFKDALGHALITHDMLPPTDNELANLDPSALIDNDGSIHLFWGNGQCYYAKLNDDLTGLDSPIRKVILQEFSEGAHIHQRNGLYYLSYGSGHPERVAYAMSRSIDGPWEYEGILNELAGNCETNRPAIIDFRGKTYFFYHNGALPNGGSHRRAVCVDYLYYNEDGTIRRIVMSTEGITLPPQTHPSHSPGSSARP